MQENRKHATVHYTTPLSYNLWYSVGIISERNVCAEDIPGYGNYVSVPKW